AVKPDLQILRRHRRPLLLRLEHPHRSAVEDHVHRPTRLDDRRSPILRIGITCVSPSNAAAMTKGAMIAIRIMALSLSSFWRALTLSVLLKRRNGEPIPARRSTGLSQVKHLEVVPVTLRRPRRSSAVHPASTVRHCC